MVDTRVSYFILRYQGDALIEPRVPDTAVDLILGDFALSDKE